MTMRLPIGGEHDTGEVRAIYSTMGFYNRQNSYPWIITYDDYLLARRARLYYKHWKAGTLDAYLNEENRKYFVEKLGGEIYHQIDNATTSV